MRSRLIVFLFCSVIIPATVGGQAFAHTANQSQSGSSKDVDAANKKGDDALKASKNAEAIDAYKQALAADPNDDHALNGLAVAYNRSGDRAKALETMKRRLEVPGQSPSVKARTLQDIALLCWDEADMRLARQTGSGQAKPEEVQMISQLVAHGAASAQTATQIAPKSAKAFSLLNLLDRTAASLETDPAKQKELMAKADDALRSSIQFYEASPQQQQSSDMFAAPMVSTIGASGDASVKIAQPTKKSVPDSLKNAKGITVTVEAFVGRDGKVSLCRAVTASGQLGDTAVEAVRHWEFQPSSFDGHPVQTVVVVSFPEAK